MVRRRRKEAGGSQRAAAAGAPQSLLRGRGADGAAAERGRSGGVGGWPARFARPLPGSLRALSGSGERREAELGGGRRGAARSGAGGQPALGKKPAA